MEDIEFGGGWPESDTDSIDLQRIRFKNIFSELPIPTQSQTMNLHHCDIGYAWESETTNGPNSGATTNTSSGATTNTCPGAISGPNSDEYIALHKFRQLSDHLFTKVVQIMFVTLEGNKFISIYHPTVKMDKEQVFRVVKDIKEILQSMSIEIVFTSTDGFDTTGAFARVMRSLGIYHVYDPVHLSKSARNHLISDTPLRSTLFTRDAIDKASEEEYNDSVRGCMNF
ncbi:hypothetical protein PPL_07816 [Heterostelium album PN500]|uniref:Uncharacterized protein n=1 Tax=Heterostelium pallidum (strain ATCC 26659 / Pp 5 / PN500) TaxID=670386 RepID=D3BH14_HETP5|nr:hypothetical protein PPL_07816 [Heterostelium album PN500]EFA79398.1 hypothetical protein PPL_07816 [Heterostelium album PN500]|eukprot:XP_020431519.1 hypothetical protein PPL_07816 [Heterostelium album PN500]